MTITPAMWRYLASVPQAGVNHNLSRLGGEVHADHVEAGAVVSDGTAAGPAEEI
jgi:hypothetical protein